MRHAHNLICSVKITICCLLFAVAGCGRSELSPPSPEIALAVEELKTNFGAANPAVTGAYFSSITQRLSEALVRVGQEPIKIEIVLLNIRESLAFSTGPVVSGNATIVLSRGLIRRLHVEAELAFVIAHEIGHLVHNHHSQRHELGVPSYRREIEQDADKFGVGLMAGAGYDPNFAGLALQHAYNRNEPSDPLYPDLGMRIATLKEEIENSGWHPPGTIDRRDFQRLRRILESPQKNLYANRSGAKPD